MNPVLYCPGRVGTWPFPPEGPGTVWDPRTPMESTLIYGHNQRSTVRETRKELKTCVESRRRSSRSWTKQQNKRKRGPHLVEEPGTETQPFPKSFSLLDLTPPFIFRKNGSPHIPQITPNLTPPLKSHPSESSKPPEKGQLRDQTCVQPYPVSNELERGTNWTETICGQNKRRCFILPINVNQPAHPTVQYLYDTVFTWHWNRSERWTSRS